MMLLISASCVGFIVATVPSMQYVPSNSVELHLPPTDAYHKLQHTIDTVNAYIKAKDPSHKLLSPERGNVVFACTHHGYAFS